MELAEADSNFGFVVIFTWLVGLMDLCVALRPGQQGLFSNMLAFLETANRENERMESMLHEIADLQR